MLLAVCRCWTGLIETVTVSVNVSVTVSAAVSAAVSVVVSVNVLSLGLTQHDSLHLSLNEWML